MSPNRPRRRRRPRRKVTIPPFSLARQERRVKPFVPDGDLRYRSAAVIRRPLGVDICVRFGHPNPTGGMVAVRAPTARQKPLRHLSRR